MGSSGTGIGRAVKRNPEKLALGPIGLVVAGQREKKKDKKKDALAAQAAAKKAAIQAKETAEKDTANEEEERKRRTRTIFTGQDLEKNIFIKTLGGFRGTTKLG